MTRWAFTAKAAAGLLALAAAFACVPAAFAGVSLALLPAVQTVTPGSEFEVTLQVTSAGSAFNGFTVYVGYDPAKLTPVPLSPLGNQIGSLMTAACSNRFHKFGYAAGVDTATVGLLCQNVSVTGPGTLYRFRFRATNTVTTTTLRFLPGTEVPNGGILAPITSQADAGVGIGTTVTLDAGDAPPPAALALSASPNPARGEVAFTFGAPLAADAELRVSDVQGRTVSVLLVPAGARLARWDGRGDGGVPAAPGLYLAELRRGVRRDVARVAIVR